MVESIAPRRDQLQAITGGDHRLMIALERLFEVAGKITPDEVAAVQLLVDGNTADIVTNAGDIGTNTANIAANAADIATNAGNIATNTGDIATNVANIATNTADIATNTADIATNTADIATNTADIATNTADIATNTADIATNTADIATNAADIATLSGLYSLCKANGNTSSADIANVEEPIVWASPAIASADVTFSGSTLTIVESGTYKLTVSLSTSSDNLTELTLRTYINGVEDTDEQANNYVARSAAQPTGDVVLATALVLSASDTVQFRGFANALGTCVMRDEGTRVLAERVA